MKQVSLILLTALCSSFAIPAGITDAERKFATDYLTETRDKVMKTVKGLTEAQFAYKSSPESWSIAECLEHIAITESGIFGWMQGTLKEGPAPDASQQKVSADDLIKFATDRSSKFKTNEASIPKNSFGSAQGSLKEFKAKRDEHIAYIKKTADDLHGHTATLPNGTVLDAYQLLIFMAAHTERHRLQIEEVMADANFPAKK